MSSIIASVVSIDEDSSRNFLSTTQQEINSTLPNSSSSPSSSFIVSNPMEPIDVARTGLNVSQVVENLKQLEERKNAKGIVQLCLVHGKEDALIAEECLWAIKNLAAVRKYRSRVAEAGAIDIIMDLLQLYGEKNARVAEGKDIGIFFFLKLI